MDRLDYLIECARTAREELLIRVKHRDSWLKLQLYVQAILWAVSNGIKLGAESSTPFPTALGLSLPISFVFASLYFVEDGIISKLSKYIGGLSQTEKELCQAQTGQDKTDQSQIVINSWDNSTELLDYAKGFPLKLRFVAQFAGFILLPGYLALLYFKNQVFEDWEIWAQVLILILIICLVVGLMCSAYVERRKAGQI